MAIALLTACRLPSTCGQLTEDVALQSAQASIRKTLGAGEQAFLATVRDTKLEREFAACLQQPVERAPFIFRASTQGLESRDGAVTEHLSVEGPLEFIVAVSESGGIYQIKGTAQSKRAIESLGHHYRLELSTMAAVSTYLRFYLGVNPRGELPRRLESLADAKKTAASRLRAAFGDQDGSLRFESWWLHHSRHAGSMDFNTHIVPTQGAFSATFYSLSDIDPGHSRSGPAFLRVSCRISRSGRVADICIEPVL